MKKILLVCILSLFVFSQSCLAHITIFTGNFNNYLKFDSTVRYQLDEQQELAVSVIRDATFTADAKKDALFVTEEKQFHLTLDNSSQLPEAEIMAEKKTVKSNLTQTALPFSKKNLPSFIIDNKEYKFEKIFKFTYTNGQILRANFLKNTENLLLEAQSIVIVLTTEEKRVVKVKLEEHTLEEWQLILGKDLLQEYEKAFHIKTPGH